MTGHAVLRVLANVSQPVDFHILWRSPPPQERQLVCPTGTAYDTGRLVPAAVEGIAKILLSSRT
jgi:hypothetical protein